METNTTLSVKEYAIKHRLTIYAVVKMARSGELPAEARVVDGKTEYFIFDDAPTKKKIAPVEEITDYKKAYFELKEKYDALIKRME